MKKVLSMMLIIGLAIAAQAQWTSLSSGVTLSLNDVHFTSADTGFVVGDSLTFLKTTNGGSTWDTVTLNKTGLLPDAPIKAISFNSTGTTGVATGELGGEYYLFKSSDGGSTWTAEQFFAFGINAVAFYDNLGCFLVGDGGEIFNLQNIGGSLQLTLLPDGNLDIIDISCKNGECVIGLANGSAYKRTTGSSTWNKIRQNDSISLKSIALLGTDEIVAVGQTVHGAYAINTIDGGTTWSTPIALGVANINDVHFPTATTGFMVGGSPFIVASNDAGDTWQAQTAPTAQPLNAVHFVNELTGYAVGDAGTVLKTENGGITNIRTVHGSTNIKAYPNPMGDLLHIEVGDAKFASGQTTIYSLTGQALLKDVVDLESQRGSIAVSILPSGIYLCQIIFENGETHNLKLIKE